jgi:hypothetical protein
MDAISYFPWEDLPLRGEGDAQNHAAASEFISERKVNTMRIKEPEEYYLW